MSLRYNPFGVHFTLTLNRAQLEDFVSNILSDKEPSITIADGLAALRVGMADTLSQNENRPVEVQSI